MASEPLISLQTLDGSAYHVCDTGVISEVTEYWSKRLFRRHTWSQIPELRKTFSTRCRFDLQRLCPELSPDHSPDAFGRLASAGLIEIRFLRPASKIGWAIPWEFLLSSATEEDRQSPLLVIRHLACGEPGKDPRPSPQTLLVHKNNPGYLGRLYRDNSLKREEKVVEVHLGLTSLAPLHNESLESTRIRMLADHPDVVHVSGVDGRQAAGLAPAETGLTTPDSDTLIVAGDAGNVIAATSGQLAPALCAGGIKPAFVGLNFVYSGADIAPATVLNGAHGALGFLNDFDDIAAEVFYFSFYLAWRLSGWNLLDALRLAWYQSSKADSERLRGSGVVLWSRDSLLDMERGRRNAFDRSSVGSPPPDLLRSFEDELDQPIPEKEHRNVRAFAEPVEQINYSLLHNDKSLFRYFYIRKPQCVGSLKDLKVNVTLHAGAKPLYFHTSGELSGSIWPLDSVVRLPLMSTEVRSIREITHTQLSVQVEWNNRSVFDRSFPVKLMPIEQWQNDAANRKWLPSFVLPRDPSVANVIDTAQPYLSALSDSIEAGFDGYQKDAVNTQVSAIWWALIGNLPLSYIGAPPTYGSNAQRLRSPSSVLKGRRGTCIDLALLLASCLEYIDLHPLLFLMKRHAFAGYYTTAESRNEVYEWLAESGDPFGDAWVLGADFHPRLMELIKKGSIVAVETTGLTKKWGYKKAIDEARQKLEKKDQLEWVMDIKLARERGVTPLPLLEGL